MGNLFRIFGISRNTEIPIESNYWVGMYMSYILKARGHSTLNLKKIRMRVRKKRVTEKDTESWFWYIKTNGHGRDSN